MGIARQSGLGPGEYVVHGPTMPGPWIELDDQPLAGGVYEVRPDGALRQLPAEQPSHQPKELSMSTYYVDHAGRPVAEASTSPTPVSAAPRRAHGPAATYARVVELSAQPGAPELPDHRGFGPRPSDTPATPTYRYVEAGDPFDRWCFLQDVANDQHLNALARRSNSYSRDYAQRLDSAATDYSYVPRWHNGNPINGRDGRPLFEDDGADIGGPKIGPSDGRRAAAETWIADQRRRGQIH